MARSRYPGDDHGSGSNRGENLARQSRLRIFRIRNLGYYLLHFFAPTHWLANLAGELGYPFSPATSLVGPGLGARFDCIIDDSFWDSRDFAGAGGTAPLAWEASGQCSSVRHVDSVAGFYGRFHFQLEVWSRSGSPDFAKAVSNYRLHLRRPADEHTRRSNGQAISYPLQIIPGRQTFRENQVKAPPVFDDELNVREVLAVLDRPR